MNAFRIAWRLSNLAFLIVGFMAHASLLAVFIAKEERLRWRTGITSRYCRRALKLLRIEVVGENGEAASSRCMVVANHVSYLDVLVLAALMPAVFVSTVEVRESTLIGQLTRLAGGVFIERRKRTRMARETGLLQDVLNRDLRLVVFPEGTTGDGRFILPFKTSILALAAMAEAPIMPVCIGYEEINGRVLAADMRRDPIVYDGDMKFFPHLFTLVKTLRRARVIVHFLPVCTLTHKADRKSLAAEIRVRMTKCLGLPV
jgi:1-acyl-sn-glycerol-3-phosphate acyltransferase